MIEIKDCLPEGWTILYSAAWQGNPTDVFTARPEAPESRSMGLSHTQLMSVSSSLSWPFCWTAKRSELG